MLYSKIKKYLSHNNIDIKDVDSFISIFDNSDNNGAFIKSWDSEKIGISQPTQESLDNIDDNTVLLQEAIDEKDLELQTQRDIYCTEEHKRLGTELICSKDADGNLEYDDSGNVIMKEGSLVYFIFSSSDQTNTLAKPAVILDSVLQKNSEGNYIVEYINYVCNIEDSSEESGFRKGFIKLTPEIALEILEHLIQRNNNYYTRCNSLREKIKDVSSIEELDNFNLN